VHLTLLTYSFRTSSSPPQAVLALLELSSRDNSRASFTASRSPSKFFPELCSSSLSSVGGNPNYSTDVRPIFEAVSKLLQSTSVKPSAIDKHVAKPKAKHSGGSRSSRRKSESAKYRDLNVSTAPGDGTFHAFVPIGSNQNFLRRDGDMQTPVIDPTEAGEMTHSPPNTHSLLNRSEARSRHVSDSDSRSSFATLSEYRPMMTSSEVKLGCKCKKTACLKLYCRCFSNKETCHAYCLCDRKQCKNTEQHTNSRASAIQNIRNRDSFAFDTKLRRGCRCVNSNCLKKYCVCFRAGAACSSDLCQCLNCKNEKDEGAPQFFSQTKYGESSDGPSTSNSSEAAGVNTQDRKRTVSRKSFFNPSFFVRVPLCPFFCPLFAR